MSAFDFDEDFEEADYASSGSFAEIREEVDSSNKVVHSEVVDLAKQLDHFQRVIDSTTARSDTDRKGGGNSKAKKQQELIDHLRKTIKMESDVDEAAIKDPHFKFVKEIAELRDQAERKLRKRPQKSTRAVLDEEGGVNTDNAFEEQGETMSTEDDFDFLDTLLSEEEGEIESRNYSAAKEAARERAIAKSYELSDLAHDRQKEKAELKKNNGFGAGFKKGFFSKNKSVSSSKEGPPEGMTSTTTTTTTTISKDKKISNVDSNGDSKSSDDITGDKGTKNDINNGSSSNSNSNDSKEQPDILGSEVFPDINEMSIDSVIQELHTLKDVPFDPPVKSKIVEKDSVDMRNAEVVDWKFTADKSADINDITKVQETPKPKPRSIFAQQMMNRKAASSTFAKPK